MSANMTGRQFKVMGRWQNAGEESAVWEVVEDRGDRVLAKLVTDKPLPIEPTEVIQKSTIDWLPEKPESWACGTCGKDGFTADQGEVSEDNIEGFYSFICEDCLSVARRPDEFLKSWNADSLETMTESEARNVIDAYVKLFGKDLSGDHAPAWAAFPYIRALKIVGGSVDSWAKANGYTVEETGGGCSALRKDGERFYALITCHDDPSAPQTTTEAVELGVWGHGSEHGTPAFSVTINGGLVHVGVTQFPR